MKILVFGPKARYDLYTPDFAKELPVSLVFSDACRSPLQAAEENPDAEVIFADAITPVRREVIECLPRLKMIHSEGVAFNAIDLEAARERGVFVCNNKGCNAGSVAEHTVMLMLMALRQGITGHNAVKAGEQIRFKERFMVSSAPELGEQTVGIIGLGYRPSGRPPFAALRLQGVLLHRPPPPIRNRAGAGGFLSAPGGAGCPVRYNFPPLRRQ